MRIERQTDGRHAVMDENGRVMGLHNSVWSAARQLHSYFGPSDADADDKPSSNKNGKPMPSAPAPQRPAQSASTGPIPAPTIPKP